MERIEPPSELDIDSLNLADVWKEWKEAWELYRISSGLHEKDAAIQIATIQSILGTKARRVLKTLPNIPGDITQRTVGGIVTALETYCVPRKNTTYERYVFRMTIQEDRSFDIFVTDLRRRAEYCDFGAIKDSLIRDQIVVGINDPKLRERLLRETDLTLNQMLFSRQIRTRVPVHPLVLVPQICHDVPELLEKRQAKYKEFYDRQGSKQLPQLKEGDSVRFKKPGDKNLSHAIVTGKHAYDLPRSYMITDETGREYRRNRRHVHLTHEPPITILDDDLIDEEPDANLEPDPPDTDSSSAPRRSTRVRSVPVWHKDYVK
ncbi:uncharacterized protein [Montipora foliosa]|uniref:uncharacterized protein n=1 Tax=Montipora foliosa TaxID=591990 RepID=UPI0035F11DC4